MRFDYEMSTVCKFVLLILKHRSGVFLCFQCPPSIVMMMFHQCKKEDVNRETVSESIDERAKRARSDNTSDIEILEREEEEEEEEESSDVEIIGEKDYDGADDSDDIQVIERGSSDIHIVEQEKEEELEDREEELEDGSDEINLFEAGQGEGADEDEEREDAEEVKVERH